MAGEGGATNVTMTSRTLAFASAVEAVTGLVLMVDPALVLSLLLGVAISGAEPLLGRCSGIALLALGLACWPPKESGDRGSAARGMLVYNLGIALCVAGVGTVGRGGGVLLWPAVTLHGVVAVLLGRGSRGLA